MGDVNKIYRGQASLDLANLEIKFRIFPLLFWRLTVSIYDLELCYKKKKMCFVPSTMPLILCLDYSATTPKTLLNYMFHHFPSWNYFAKLLSEQDSSREQTPSFARMQHFAVVNSGTEEEHH